MITVNVGQILMASSIIVKYSISQLLSYNQWLPPPCIPVIKQLGLLRRPRYVHRSSRNKFVYRQHNAASIPSIWSTTARVAPVGRHQSSGVIGHCSNHPPLFPLRAASAGRNRNHGVDYSVLRSLQRLGPKDLSSATMELFNTQSLTNKSLLIYDHILDKKLDFMCLVETWHKPGDYSVLNEACPQGYCYLEKARRSGRGGGLAVIHRAELKLSPLPLPDFISMECLAFKCKPPHSMTVLLIYRPPKSHSLFLTEIHDLLTSLCSVSSNIVIIGDVNIHVDNPSCQLSREFLSLLDCLGLQQHVKAPTHTRGHTLDLVITDSVPIKSLDVYDLGVSDHKVVSMAFTFQLPTTRLKRQMSFRNWKHIDQNSMTADLKQISCPAISTVDELVDHYNASLSSVFDLHAPIKTREVTFVCSAPWYTQELRRMKMAGRALERHYRKSGLTVHKLAFRDHQRTYFKSLKDARCQFYSNQINKNTGNSKQLFATISHFLEPQKPSSTEVTKERCNNFIDFFRSKISNIRSLMPGSYPPPSPALNPLIGSLPSLPYFTEFSSSQIDEILRGMKSTSCTLDPIPTVLLKSYFPIVSPIITKLVNLSLQTGHVPPSLKAAVIRPVLKKPSLDPEELASYRPISNLTFLSKVLEKTVASQLQNHLRRNNLFEKFQSGFRSAHSTETALLRVTNDLLMTADAGSPSLLILLDLSAAFDTVDHTILLDRLHHTVGLSGTALQWFQSYLSGRTECVMLGGCKSRLSTVTCGVPQGSVLGPILFTIYMLPLGHVISRHGLSFHCYADDTQLYIKTVPNPSEAISHLTACLEEIKAWMNGNFLQLNSSKTEGLLVGTPHQIRSFPISQFLFDGKIITLSSSVTNLGVQLDAQLTYSGHIKHLCKTSFYQLRKISKLRPLLTLPDAEKLVHAFISSRLDYCNGLFVGIPAKDIQKLQYIQNSAARILMKVRKFEHITPILKSLHWLPVSTRIEYKIILLTHKCIFGQAPSYLKDLINLQLSNRTLRSSGSMLLQVPFTKLCTMGGRAFCSAAPQLWNHLPVQLRVTQRLDTFKANLKTFLFRKAYNC